MDILTLELGEVTLGEALLELNRVLLEHPSLPLRVLSAGDEVMRQNLERHLARQGRAYTLSRTGRRWQLDVQPGEASAPLPRPPATQSAPASPAPTLPRPVAVLRGAFAPGDRALGRSLLLGVLSRLPADTPWVLLAHEGCSLLEDPRALEVLHGLPARGIPVQVSRESAAWMRLATVFPTVEDAPWQTAYARGELTLL